MQGQRIGTRQPINGARWIIDFEKHVNQSTFEPARSVFKSCPCALLWMCAWCCSAAQMRERASDAGTRVQRGQQLDQGYLLLERETQPESAEAPTHPHAHAHAHTRSCRLSRILHRRTHIENEVKQAHRWNTIEKTAG